MSQRTRKVFRFHGHVQGVGFRFRTVELSKGLSVGGFVRNEPDGSVTLDVEGEPAMLKKLVDRIESEMRGHIDSVTSDQREPSDRTGGLRIEY